jgi:UDP-N-acetylglucosamine 2-epimerase (non-hydrolysing)
MKKLAFILGTRPEIIKLAPLIREAKRRGEKPVVVFTGQHRHLAKPLFRFFGIRPDIDLDVMTPGQTLTSLSAKLLQGLDQELDRKASRLSRVEAVVVQGDTTSGFIGAYWAFCKGKGVAHVEAGLRTRDLRAPFPEEGNRQLIGRLADWHFAPTAASRDELLKEYVPASRIRVVGNTGIDALKAVLAVPESKIPRSERVPAAVSRFAAGAKLVLVTAHRRESFGEGFRGICEGLVALADAREDVRLVYPVHPNPEVRKACAESIGEHPRILLCEPLPFLGFAHLMARASLLLTDSGGIQEEGPSLRKPILVMREKTERPEGVEKGFSRLVGTDARKIAHEAARAIDRGCEGRGASPYGDGRSSARILDILARA